MSHGECCLLHQWDQLEIHDDLLGWGFHYADEHTKLQLIVPHSQQQAVFIDMHVQDVRGHLGQFNTLSCIHKRFYWPGHTPDVKMFCRTCPVRKPSIPPVRASLQNISAGYPMQIVATIITTPACWKKCILGVIHYRMGWSFIPSPIKRPLQWLTSL